MHSGAFKGIQLRVKGQRQLLAILGSNDFAIKVSSIKQNFAMVFLYRLRFFLLIMQSSPIYYKKVYFNKINHGAHLQVFHQLYCSTNYWQFQHNFLIIIANFIIHTSFAFTHP